MIKSSAIKRFANAAKQENMIIEVEKDGVIVRFIPEALAKSARERDELSLNAELAAFDRKNGYGQSEIAINPWDAARLDRKK